MLDSTPLLGIVTLFDGNGMISDTQGGGFNGAWRDPPRYPTRNALLALSNTCWKCHIHSVNSTALMPEYPDVSDSSKVGTHPATAGAGGGYVWDEVLEYRVWCHPERGAPDEADRNDYFYAFATYGEALKCSRNTLGAEEPLALILQREHINEVEPGRFVHVLTERIAEWPPEFLSRPRRTPSTIPDFLAPDAPPNRLDIIRGTASKPL